MAGVGQQADARSARAHALAVLRIRSSALGAALLPAAVAVILLAGHTTGHLGPVWETPRWIVTGVALAVLAAAAAVAAVIARARPAVSPTVPLEEREAPDLYALVRDLADRLDVPAPSALALTPDCDSWLEDRTHPAQSEDAGRPRGPRGSRSRDAAPVLVIGSPFLWWMRVAELRALLAPVVAGTGPSAHPDIAAARRFVRGLDAAVAVAERARTTSSGAGIGTALRLVGVLARVMLRASGPHAAEMERGVAAAASERAQSVDYGLRVVAQEQVGLAYAGWDRLLTRVALPAWRLGLWPSRLDAGVVSALTELSRRDRLAEGFTSRLGERPACDLLEEPGAVDGAVSLLAARLFHGPRPTPGPGGPAPEWTPVDWSAYPEEVVDRIWRTEAARLFDALADREPAPRADADGTPDAPGGDPARDLSPSPSPEADRRRAGEGDALCGPTLARVLDHLTGSGSGSGTGPGSGSGSGTGEALAARISADVAREEAAGAAEESGALSGAGGVGAVPGAGDMLPAPPAPMGLPLRPPRSGRELLADHVTAAVCCATVDTAGGAPGLDWLDGPTLLVAGERRTDLSRPVLALVEEGDAQPLREWLASVGVRPDKPVRLV
ncbi:hypothetical protein GCM10009801_21870 [Streptomyces albiaxialis]|uniref:Integral membrane protein n=1 Tax=Streptomyces albiaxialis TaxID=329523 RepID=A0ABP5HEE8_9ACTN